MANDPRRDPRAQRQAQLMAREKRQLYPVLEMQEPEEEEESYDVSETGDVVIGPNMGPRRFFADEPQETTIPVEDWGPDHPLWMALKRGDVRITRNAQGQEVMVDRRLDARQDRDLFPIDDYAMGQDVGGLSPDGVGSLARVKYGLSKTLTMYASTDPALAGSSLLVAPEQGNTTLPPVGGAVMCGMLDFGHKGAGKQVWFDMPAGQIVKQSFAGSFGKLSARLWPQYFKNSDDNGAKLRKYLLFPGGPILTTELWNSIPSGLMGANNFPTVIAGANVLPNGTRGWFGEGIQPLDSQSRPQRRFYGSVIGDGTIADWSTRCPIANAATYVMLIGGLYDKTNPALQSLSFLQNLAATSGVNPQIGPFPVNTLIALDAKCESIDVINSPNVVGTGLAPFEVPFELLYFLSF